MKNALFLLAQSIEEYEASVFTDGLGWSRDVGDFPVNGVTAGRRAKIICSWNFTVIPEFHMYSCGGTPRAALALNLIEGFETTSIIDT
ncbi:MAG: hypothetical protein P8X55_16450 [Desulfosarcinaceae bacterium]